VSTAGWWSFLTRVASGRFPLLGKDKKRGKEAPGSGRLIHERGMQLVKHI
jgi:hypothetical protein